MAQGIQHVCGNCHRTIEAWSDGNPYYISERRRKKYAYHPDHKNLERCVGNDAPHLCLSCGAEFMVDSRSPISACPQCGAADIADTYELDGSPCPFCKAGVFALDPNFLCIS